MDREAEILPHIRSMEAAAIDLVELALRVEDARQDVIRARSGDEIARAHGGLSMAKTRHETGRQEVKEHCRKILEICAID